MDPYLCCLLQLCCADATPEDAEKRFKKLVNMRMARGGCDTEACAEAVVKFDLELVAQVKAALMSKP